MALRRVLNCSILLTDLPLLRRPAAAAAAGFDAVEFWWPFATAAPADAEVERFAAAIEDADVRLTGLNLYAGDMAAGERGIASWPGRESEFRDSVDIAAALGTRLGTSVFNTLYGNRIDAATGQAELAEANLALAVQRLPGTPLLEPLSGAARYPLRTGADALAVLDRVPGVGLLADLYHLTVNGDDVDALIAAHTDRITHVQIADAPGRHEPGTGSIPFERHLAALVRCGYHGCVSLEYVASLADPFAWLADATW